jgi:hypothetical protein
MVLMLAWACTAGTGGGDTTSNADTATDSGADPLPGQPDDIPFGCDPGAADAEVDELEVATLTFTCRGGATPTQWLLTSGPPGATFDETAGTLTWTTDLASAGEWPVAVEAIQGDSFEGGKATIWVADAFDAPRRRHDRPRCVAPLRVRDGHVS